MTEGHTERLEAALAGRYRIERKLGEGGMASVYLAEDLKHERKVALKILRPELAAVIGAERFLSEIKTTANLQHPHILALFDSGEAGGYLYYVMPYVDGETLREKLDREKQLGVDESISIARDVADALDYAHRAGVIHRDIKPGNILLHDGRPVVADFGIALAVSAAGGGRMTETGLSLGTPHYMSPEQASADRDLSVRSDVYSLGCVLYEMIAGQPPHTGPSAQSILVRILTESPRPLTQLRHTVPPNVAAAVAKSIEKLPADRFESAKEFREALDDAAFNYQAVARTEPGTAAQTAAAVRAASPASPWLRDRRSVAALAVGATMTALAAWGLFTPLGEAGIADVMRFTIVPPAEAPLAFVGNQADLAISPDGRLLAYKSPVPDRSAPQLNLRALDELESTPIRGGEGGLGPFFSPDGAWVGFVHYQNVSVLQRVSTLGGAPVVLTDAPSEIVGASWGRGDQIVFGTRDGGLYRVSGGGGEPEALTTLDPELDREHLWPSFIGDRDAVVFTVNPQGGTPPSQSGQLAVLDLGTGEVTRLGLDGFSPRYVATGHLVYAVGDGSVRAVPFDARSLTVTGSTVPLLEGVQVKASGGAAFDVSGDGRLVYALGGAAGGAERSLVWVDRTGREEALPAEPRGYVYPRLSPDGSRVALDVRGDSNDIWVWDFRTETLTRMILGEVGGAYPVWTPDGQRIAYQAGIDFYWKAANNTGAPEVLVETPGAGGADRPNPYFFTPDGSALVFRDQSNPDTDDDLAMVSLESGSVDWRLTGAFVERNAELSPDGRWMAYQSDESGEYQIYVRPFPDVDADRVQVSNNGGLYPLWSRDGRELFYLQGGQLVAVQVDPSGEAFSFGERTALIDFPYRLNAEGRVYDVSLDGQRFLAVKVGDVTETGASPEIHVVLNWFQELRERMGSD